MSFTLFIRNMVSNACKEVITRLLLNLHLKPQQTKLGEVLLDKPPTQGEIIALKHELNKAGYGLIEDNKAHITAQIKSLLEELLLSENYTLKLKLSEYITNKVRYEYHYLSALFSQMEQRTIEQYFIQLRIERIKDLIKENRLSLSEISYKFGYSSPAHLSNQFKKVTGETPTKFRANTINKNQK